MQLIPYILKNTQLPEKGIQNTVALLNEDCSVPFISRYRKERTGNLDEVQIGLIVNFKTQFKAIEKRKATILKALDEQNVLKDELREKINKAGDLTTLEDIYLPFKKSKKTKAETARKNGLESLAKIIMAQRNDAIEFEASNYLNNTIQNEDEALEGARHIIAEWVNERSDIRNQIRYQLERSAQIITKVITAKKEDEKAQKFRDYFDWSESLNRCPSHRLLAILRAENEGFIRIKIEIDDERTLEKIEHRILKSNGDCASHIKLAIQDSYKRLLFPSLSNEILKKAK
ncbi:MAG: RNA-binding transcriptional accessory protein, partial [Maribacter sp.]|nr:RNA-binding transcriptional accessory protein [Maribacter sp.]